MEPADSEADLLRSCPRCEYPLTGLPVEHHCPECGVIFDRRWTLAAPSGNTPAFFWKVRAPLGGTIVVLSAIAGWISLRAGNLGPVVHAALFLGFGLFLVFTGIRAWRRPTGFIALGKEGLIVYSGGETHEVFPWSTIHGVNLDNPGYGLILSLTDCRKRLRGHTFLHGSGPELMDCMERIRMYRVRHQSKPAS